MLFDRVCKCIDANVCFLDPIHSTSLAQFVRLAMQAPRGPRARQNMLPYALWAGAVSQRQTCLCALVYMSELELASY